MSPTAAPITPEELEALRALSRAQGEAARTGDLACLGALLTERGRLLGALRGRPVPPGSLDEICALDAEARARLGERIGAIQAELVRLRRGGWALGGYASPVPARGGFIDQLR